MLDEVMNQNFTSAITQQSHRNPTAIAVMTSHETISYAQLENLILSAVALLHSYEINEEDVVALLFEDEFLLLITMLALARMGITLCSLSPNTPEILLHQTLQSIHATIILSEMKTLKATNVRLHVKVDLPLIQSFTPSKDTALKSNDKPWQLVLGSGSTGNSKIIPITHAQQCARNFIASSWLPMAFKDKVMTLVHLNYNVTKDLYFYALEIGATIVLPDKQRANIFQVLNQFNITILHTTVFHIHSILMMLSQYPLMSEAFKNLKVLLIGGSTVSQATRNTIKLKLTPNLYVRYGIKEVGSISVAHAPKVFSLQDTVGNIHKMTTMQIVDEKNHTVALGEVGHIRIKSPGMVDGYLDDKEETAKAFKDGWFYPGDLGKFTEDGQLIYCGRSDHMMIMNGTNIYPAEIEAIMTQHPDVLDAAAMPIKHPVHQDIPICAVILKADSTVKKEELLKFCYERLDFRSPKEIVILEKIPRNEQGKLIRNDLAQAIVSVLR